MSTSIVGALRTLRCNSGGTLFKSKSTLTRVTSFVFFFQAEDGIRDLTVTGVQTCALPISTIYSTTTGTGGTQNLSVTGTGRYIRMYGTARGTQYGYSLWEFQVFGPASGGGGTGCTGQSNTPNFGPNVYVFDPSMSSSSIQATLDNVFNTQKLNQFGTQRYALLFKPGTYSNTANIGYYTSIQGLGQNPDDVTINGDVTVDSFDGTGNATQNFWRSAENLAINPSAGNDRWAVAQAGPFRRVA